MHEDFLFSESLPELNPNVHELIQIETERQFKKLILFPGDSYTPCAAREALGIIYQKEES